MATISTIEPNAIIKGDTVKWKKSLPDYLPGDGWELTYAFVLEGASSDHQDATATDNGDGTHLVSFSSSDFEVGIYHWQAYVTKAGERYTVANGQLSVKPDFATLTSGYDNRSHVKKVLDAIEAVLENRASEEQNYIMIGSTQITNIPHGELLALRSKYRIEYQRELQATRLANGLSGGNKIKVRF